MIRSKILYMVFALCSTLFVNAHDADLNRGNREKGNYLNKQDSILLSFAMNCKGGEQGTRYFYVMLSTDFKGEAVAANIQKAQWVDITDRFTFPDEEDSDAEEGIFTEIKAVDIADLITPGEPFTIVLRQTVKDQMLFGRQSQIRIRNFKIERGTENNREIIFDHQGAEWSLFTNGNFRPNRPNISTSQVVLRGNHGNDKEYLKAETEAWVISKPLLLDK